MDTTYRYVIRHEPHSETGRLAFTVYALKPVPRRMRQPGRFTWTAVAWFGTLAAAQAAFPGATTHPPREPEYYTNAWNMAPNLRDAVLENEPIFTPLRAHPRWVELLPLVIAVVLIVLALVF